MKYIVQCLLMLFISTCLSQNANFISQDLSINVHIDGTLLTPAHNEIPTLAIIIADSGPTDRNGNQNFLKSNTLKKLAEGLSNDGIATFRYDKRIVKQIRKGNVDPNITFDDFVTDAISVIDYFKKQDRFSKIHIIGHGQGSLVGMLAAKDKADSFISLAGSGQTIDKVILEQVAKMDSTLVDDTKRAFKSLNEGKITKEYPAALGSIFSADVQPFMMNWMQYNPLKAIKDLEIPILVINGTKDLQVPVAEAKLLKTASQKTELKLIDKMNHVLFIIEGKELENSKSYNESFRKLSEDLLLEIASFIKKE